MKDVLTFGLTGEEYETLMANIDVDKLLEAMEDDNVDFAALIDTSIFSANVPGDAAVALINKIREAGSDTILNLLKLDSLTKDQFENLPIAAIFNALTPEEKSALFAGIDAATLMDLVNGLQDEDKSAIVNSTIGVADLAGYLDDAFIDELYADGLLTATCPWFDVQGATEKYSEGKTYLELYEFSQLDELAQIKELVSYLSGIGMLADYIDFAAAMSDSAMIEKVLPKMIDSVDLDTLLTYFDTTTLFELAWGDENRKNALISAVCAHFAEVPTDTLYNIIKVVGYENFIDVKRSMKFMLDNFTTIDIIDNYVVEEKLVEALSTSLFAKEGDAYKVISPEDFIALDIAYEHYIDVSAFINLILSNEFIVGGEVVDAKYVIDKFGLDIIKIDEVAKYLFEKDADGNYRVISPNELIDTLSYKDSFMTALIQLIINQIRGGQLAASVIIDAYSDVLAQVVNINEVVKLLPKHIFKYLNDDDKAYFSNPDNVDRSTFIEVVVKFLIQFITGADNIKVNTSFNNADNEAFADIVLNGSETDEEIIRFLDSFILVGKTHFHTGEHDDETMPVLSDDTIPMYEGYRTAFVSLANAYKAFLDAIPDMYVFTDIPDDGIIGGINVHFDYRQWMDDFYFDGEGDDPTFEIDVEAWEAAKKEIDFGVKVGLYEEDPAATYGPNHQTAIRYIEDFVQRRIDEGNSYEISIQDDGTRLIDVDLFVVQKYSKIISRALKSNRVADHYKIDFINAINGTVGEFIHYLRFDLTTEAILDIIDGINNSSLDSAADFIEAKENRIDSVRERILTFLEDFSESTKSKKFIEHFYRGNGLFTVNGKRTVSTDKVIETASGKNSIIDRFLEVLNEGDKVVVRENFDITFETLYQIKFNDKNGTLKVMYLPAGTELSIFTDLFDELSDECKWYVKDDASGKYTEVTKMPEADSVVYKAYTVRFHAETGEIVGERDFIHGADSIMGYPPVVPFKEGTQSGVWEDYTLGDTNIDVYPDYELNVYDVVWVIDEENDIRTNSSVEYGETPVFPYGTPEKEADDQYTYEFSHWEDANGKTPEQLTVADFPAEPQETPFVYYAKYNTTTNKYTVTWNNYDGTELEKDTDVDYGANPEYNGETPTKPATAQYTYTFSGWDPEISEVTGDVTYTAQFSETVNKYTVTWMNGNTEIYNEEVAYGETPVYNEVQYGVPAKAADAQYTYTFSGWQPQIDTVTGNVTYVAQFSETVNKYTVTWKNGNDTIYSEEVEYGTVPSYNTQQYGTPTQASTDQYSYTFIGWDPDVAAVTGDVEYAAQFGEVTNKYTITWKDDLGNVIDTTEVEYGALPTHADPTKAATAQYTYTFIGWTPGIAAVTGEATYTAQFSSTVNKYTITWKDDLGNTIDTTEVEYGTIPAHTDPTKAATAQYTYTFSGWTPEVVAVTGEATYKATFGSTVNKYTVIWKNYDGTTLETDADVEYGADPVYNGEMPTRPATEQNTYNFVGWDPEIDEVTGNVTYTAKFDAVAKKYTVIWKNYNGDVLETTSDVEYNAIPDYPGETPEKAGNDTVSYVFIGWSDGVIDGDTITYTAQFSEETNLYTIIWKTDATTVFDTIENVNYATYQAYPIADPTKAATTQYTYTFANWSVVSSEVIEGVTHITYMAQFNQTVNKYTITWKDDLGNVIDTTEVEFGSLPTHDDPTKAATAQYTYTFNGWTPEIVAVTGEATYTATFSSTVNKYTITWKDDLGNVIDTTEVEYGALPTHADPSKAATAQYTYTFAGWTPEIVAVTGEATYTATFGSTVNVYTITWKDDGGNVIDTTEVAYGELPTHDDPTKAATAQYTYTFGGWTPEVGAVTGEAA